MTLADYLAKNYLTADPTPDRRPTKKRKKDQPKQSTEPAGLIIADDDLTLSSTLNNGNASDEDGPLVYGGNSKSAEFRRSRKSNWKTIGAVPPTDSDQAAADAILASAAEEGDRERRAEEDEGDAPAVVVVDEEGGDDSSAKMESGAKAGLQTAAQTAAMMDAARKKREKEKRDTKDEGQGETVYRDATGRRIDVQLRRAEMRKEEEEKRRKAMKEMEAQKGDVQRLDKENRKRELEDAKLLTLARFADDEEMNDELRGRERWDDPMAAYVEKKGGGKSRTGRPLYKGASQPNRYGIRPGHRWDGVDRGNGFEKDWFQARGRKERNKQLEYEWQMDD